MLKRFLFVVALSISALLISYLPMAGAQGLTLTSKSVKGDIPLHPLSPAWDKIEGMIVPLSSQLIAEPRAFKTPKGMSSVRWISAKSINNGQVIAFLLEWDDMTENTISVLNDTYQFRDAVALGFPVTIPKSEEEYPYFGMGHEGAPVNIWQWKADLEDGRDRAVPLGASYPGEGSNSVSNTWYPGIWYDYPSKDMLRKGPVEDLIAVGFSTLSLQDSQDVNGRGIWSGGKWRVVIYRDMTTNDKEDANLKPGITTPIVFAVWDGSNDERDGMKSITTWHHIKIE